MDPKMRETMIHDYVEVVMGDHEFAAWMRKQDRSWNYESFDTPPGTYFLAKGKTVAIAFYNNAKSTHKIFIHKDLCQPIDILRAEAIYSCRCRGHEMKWAPINKYSSKRYSQIGACVKCGKEVRIDTKPEPNGIDIGGEAVALNCKD